MTFKSFTVPSLSTLENNRIKDFSSVEYELPELRLVELKGTPVRIEINKNYVEVNSSEEEISLEKYKNVFQDLFKFFYGTGYLFGFVYNNELKIYDVYTNNNFLSTRDMYYLESNYSDLLMVSDDLHVIVDLFLHLYGQKFLVDDNADCIYSTELKNFNRRKLNYIGIMMELERLTTLHERNVLTWEDIDESVELLNKYGYDINQDNSYRTDDLYETAANIEERLNLIFNITDD